MTAAASSNGRAGGDDWDDSEWEVAATAAYLCARRAQRVALQLPDELVRETEGRFKRRERLDIPQRLRLLLRPPSVRRQLGHAWELERRLRAACEVRSSLSSEDCLAPNHVHIAPHVR